MAKRRMMTMDGNNAAAYVSYPFTEIAGIFPITPSSQMAEMVDEWAAEGKKNLFGKPVQVVEMQSEAGAAATMHGALQGGALASTYTAAQGLALMIPTMYKLAGELLPGVYHVASRALTGAVWSIFGDHQDVMSCRQTGFAMLASSSVQEIMHLGAIAHLAAIKARFPFLHFFDGFRSSHEIQKITVLENEELSKLLDWEALDAFRERAQSPDAPKLIGMTQNPDVFFQLRESVNPFVAAVPEIVEGYMDEINALCGTDYKLFNYYGPQDAERVIIGMGSGMAVTEETVDAMNKAGSKVGCVNVHLYRPFRADKLLAVIPKTVKKIAVLDRTKEPGCPGEPLYLDVCAAYCNAPDRPVIVGGRYGLGSKDFTPSMVVSVFENLELAQPRNDFSVGIVDDVTHTSLPEAKNDLDTTPAGVTACKFWGFGSDGTVGANKTAIKIIGDHTEMYAQAYFAYDSKKSGGVTVSHLRFGNSPIKSSYLVDKADFVACHKPSYVGRYDLLKGLKKGGVFLLNCMWTKDELDANLPADMKRYLARNDIKFYIINATALADGINMPGHINMIMQSAFFKVMPIIPVEDAVRHMKDGATKAYFAKGQAVVDKNHAAVDLGVDAVEAVAFPASWKDATGPETGIVAPKTDDADMAAFVDRVVMPMTALKGDDLPVSAFTGYEDGRWKMSISRFEKRGVAVTVPVWKPEKCIQCNQCSFVCPHAVIRPMLATEEELKGAPEGFKTTAATGFNDMRYHLAISALDCMDCGLCAKTCPAKEKALVMEPLADQRPLCEDYWVFSQEHISYKPMDGQKITVKTSQFLQPMNEFSGACAGCGETPYAILLTQLYGDRMVISNPAGCTAVWAAGAPSVAYSTNNKGHGPGWTYSLFEDCGEYGFGIYLGMEYERDRTVSLIKSLLGKGIHGELKDAAEDWLTNLENGEKTRDRADRLVASLTSVRGQDPVYEELLKMKKFFIKRSMWVFGGDGWAYDIGFGGLDQVLSFGQNLNIFVYDTEVYSNTGGQASKATPTGAIAQFAAAGRKGRKKDLGMMAMTYGNVYVAQIAMGADKAHTLKVIQEAEAYPGTSLIIAYAPCINHGIKGGMVNSQEQTKRAVESGYWHLFRYNPLLKTKGENPFIMDSKEPKLDTLKEYLMSEVRYSALYRKFPDHADAVIAEAVQNARERYESYLRLL
jgi:pyruvate:ferredoxin (flavodoxin) oxidoreductase, homodimeric